MNIDKIFERLKTEPKFRLKQVNQLLFKELIEDWNQATTLAKAFREELTADAPLAIKAEHFASKDGSTVKALITLNDGRQIETVLMKMKDRATVCVSTQIGCAVNCAFCATGKMGFCRNLTAGEMVEQVLYFERLFKKENLRVSNIVFMGMGEPFLNYDNLIAAIKLINDKDGLDIGIRKISVSTSGIIDGINKFSDEEMDVNLAISLHAPDDELRSKLIPINAKFPIKKILEAVDSYIAKTKRKVMFEYILLKDVNDSDAQAKALVKIMKKPLYMVNLVPYNATGMFEPSTRERIAAFRNILEDSGVFVTERYRFGDDIKAACGQLATSAK